MRNPNLPHLPVGPAKFLGLIFGLIPLGIGITVLIFLWGVPFGEFGSPPLFFQVFGSFVALGFVAFGGAACYGALAGGRHLSALAALARTDPSAAPTESSPTPARSGYICPQCSAPLQDGAEVSPHGDVKCTYCKCWFNIHAPST